MIYLKFIRRCFTKCIPMAVKITSITTIAEIKYAEKIDFWIRINIKSTSTTLLCTLYNFNFYSILKSILISRRLNVAVWLLAEKVKTVFQKKTIASIFLISLKQFLFIKIRSLFFRLHIHLKSKTSPELLLKEVFIIFKIKNVLKDNLNNDK